MIELAKMGSSSYNNDVQNFGMHPLHYFVQESYGLNSFEALNNYNVFLWQDVSRTSSGQQTLQHISATETLHVNYPSWRRSQEVMKEDRKESNNILFFTTFHKNGYELYGKT
jgi:hypothetical protein